MASLYLVDDLTHAAPGSFVVVEGAEGKHAATVARVRVGERLRLGDGTGLLADGTVTAVERDRLVVSVEALTIVPPARPQLVLVQALAKDRRDEMAVQAATEVGVDVILPWAAGRSVSRWDGPKQDKGRQRWASIAREAAKQAVRSTVPRIGPVVTTGELLRGPVDPAWEAPVSVLVLDPSASTRLSAWTPDAAAEAVAIVVGPEGGIDDADLDRFVDSGAQRLRLGDSVLRTSTAGPVSLAMVQAALGRW